MINLIWDLDGTLIDSSQEVMEALHLALKDAGLDEIRIIHPLRVGPTIDTIIRTSFPQSYITEDKLVAAVAAFRTRYDHSSFEKTTAFEGIPEIIHDVVSYRHYIITNKPDYPSVRIIEKLGWSSCITKLITPYTYNKEKKLTKEELFKMLVSNERLEIDRSYGIGDMITDYNGAKPSGIHTIGVLWGTGTASELEPCEFKCETPHQLSSLLEILA